VIDLDAIKSSGLNGDTHAALLLERHRSAQRLEVLLELARKERADLELINGEIAACERAAMEADSEASL
jgi:hypothetical protein